MSYSLEFELQGLPNLANRVFRGNWRARHGKAQTWKKRVASVVTTLPPEPLKRAKLTLTRLSHMRPDYDGLVTSFKPIIDGLVDIGVLENDKHENIGVPEYLWERAKQREGRVRVRVEELNNNRSE